MTTQISRVVMRYYLDPIFSLGLEGDGDELPPENINEYAPQIPPLAQQLVAQGDVEFFKLGVEYLLLSSDEDELERFNPVLYPFDGDEIQEILAFCYETLFPEAELPESQPDVEWKNWSLTEWREHKGLPQPKPEETFRPITDLRLTKAEFAILLARVVGEPFVLDGDGLRELALTETEIDEARINLAARHYIGLKSGVHLKLQEAIETIFSSGWKCVADVKAQSADWSQISLHFGDNSITGETFNEQEERLLTQLTTVDEAIAWLLGLLPLRESSGNRAPRTLDKLLPKAEIVVTFLVVDGADDSENAAKSVSVFLQTDKGLWFIGSDADEQRAINLTADGLREKLVMAAQQFLPQT